MNRERAKELLPIIQAFAEGKEIEYKPEGGVWTPFDSQVCGPEFLSHNQYRIKPNPRYIWLNVYERYASGSYSTKKQADFNAGDGRVGCMKILIEDRWDE